MVLYSTISPDGFSFESSSTASDARLSILPMSCTGVCKGSRIRGKREREERGKRGVEGGGGRSMENYGSRTSKRVKKKEARGIVALEEEILGIFCK